VMLPVTALRTGEPSRPADLAYPKKHGSRFEVEDNDGEDIPSSAAVDATDRVPYAGGWSLAPARTGGSPFWVAAQNSALDVTPNSDTRDGPVLARSEMQRSVAPSPAETETADAIEHKSSEEIARAEQPEAFGAVPLPQRKPMSSAGAKPVVRTVKVVTIKAPPPSRPHDGAYALGTAAEAPRAPAEWVETKSPVDMHAKAEQSSETVKVADGGLKVRVTARDKNWVQVSDPATSTTGWIYNRFLEPTEPPAQ
jgi:hypothetical protein